jgi:DNA-directed RNA polymerase subunit RPC12/RpoP
MIIGCDWCGEQFIIAPELHAERARKSQPIRCINCGHCIKLPKPRNAPASIAASGGRPT